MKLIVKRCRVLPPATQEVVFAIAVFDGAARVLVLAGCLAFVSLLAALLDRNCPVWLRSPDGVLRWLGRPLACLLGARPKVQPASPADGVWVQALSSRPVWCVPSLYLPCTFPVPSLYSLFETRLVRRLPPGAAGPLGALRAMRQLRRGVRRGLHSLLIESLNSLSARLAHDGGHFVSDPRGSHRTALCTFPVPSLYLPCTFPVPSLYLPCTFVSDPRGPHRTALCNHICSHISNHISRYDHGCGVLDICNHICSHVCNHICNHL